MEKFTKVTGVAAPLPMVNIDTDKIIPKQFLKTIERTGLGKGLFYELRTDTDGNNTGEFVLDREPYTDAKIIVVGENFGCGSSIGVWPRFCPREGSTTSRLPMRALSWKQCEAHRPKRRPRPAP